VANREVFESKGTTNRVGENFDMGLLAEGGKAGIFTQEKKRIWQSGHPNQVWRERKAPLRGAAGGVRSKEAD